MNRLFRRPAVSALVGASVVVVVVVAVVVEVSTAPSAPAASAPPRPVGGVATLAVTAGRCAAGWRGRTAGTVTFRVENRTVRPGEIYLFNPYTGVTVSKSALRPRTTSRLAVHLTAGRYRWSCRLRGLPVRSSPTATVTPAPIAGPAGPMVIVPVTPAQMAEVIAAYRSYVEQQLALDTGQVGLLAVAVTGGQMQAARAAWLTAHQTWHRIGGAYDAFGQLGLAIDGTAARLQDGTTSPQFTGFHKVEMDLWQDDDLAAAGADTATLARDMTALSVRFPTETIAATDVPLRTHEILEDALRDELSGDDDYGSGTDMASVAADVDGTRELLSLLTPLLQTRAAGLVALVTRRLDALSQALVASQVDGRWVGVTAVTVTARETVDADIGTALEALDVVPELLPVQGVAS